MSEGAGTAKTLALGPDEAADLSSRDSRSVALLRAAGVLERLPYRSVEETLGEWFRVLEPGGLLLLAVPDFDTLCRLYLHPDVTVQDRIALLRRAFGAVDDRQAETLSGFNPELLASSLHRVGFREIVRVKDFGLADAPPPQSFRGVDLDLNVTARRPLGRPQPRPEDPDAFLAEVAGVIHVGANTGQERYLYAGYGLNVAWVEPIPAIFDRLQQNIARLPEQRALRALVAERDGEMRPFNIANNDGKSSSLLALEQHRDIWPEVGFEDRILLETVTLATLAAREGLDAARYDALVLDTQGAELLVLRGAESLLGGFRYIKTEAADFEAYRGCARLPEIHSFLAARGFREHRRTAFAHRAAGGTCYDIVYRRDG